MNVLVTGGTGFLGKSVVSEFRNTCNVISIGRKNIEADNLCYIQWDITNSKWPNEINDIEIDYIIHCAAELSMDDFCENLINVNCNGTFNVFKLAVDKKVKRVFYISSLPIIGKPEGVITESVAASPLTVYHATKAFGEMIVSQLPKYDVGYSIFRIPSPVGAGMPQNTILSIMINNAMKNEPLQIYGKGTRRQNYIDVRDISYALLRCAETKKMDDGIYNLASDRTYSNLEVATLCIDVLKSKSEIIFSDKDDIYDDWEYTTNIVKLEGVIGKYIYHDLKTTIRDIAGAK